MVFVIEVVEVVVVAVTRTCTAFEFGKKSDHEVYEQPVNAPYLSEEPIASEQNSVLWWKRPISALARCGVNGHSASALWLSVYRAAV